MRTPSISINRVECPSHVTRKPLCGCFVHTLSGLVAGNGPRGTRRSPPHMKSLSDGMGTAGSRRFGSTGCTF